MEKLSDSQLKQARSQIASENGKKGGRNRALALSSARRSEIARKAGKMRWKNAKKNCS